MRIYVFYNIKKNRMLLMKEKSHFYIGHSYPGSNPPMFQSGLWNHDCSHEYNIICNNSKESQRHRYYFVN